jgi:hypothetical protein
MSLPVIRAMSPISVKEMIKASRNRVKSCTTVLKMFGVFIRYVMTMNSRIKIKETTIIQTV